jgi:hypothetical protein
MNVRALTLVFSSVPHFRKKYNPIFNGWLYYCISNTVIRTLAISCSFISTIVPSYAD